MKLSPCENGFPDLPVIHLPFPCFRPTGALLSLKAEFAKGPRIIGFFDHRGARRGIILFLSLYFTLLLGKSGSPNPKSKRGSL
jgi:hypothetical protein